MNLLGTEDGLGLRSVDAPAFHGALRGLNTRINYYQSVDNKNKCFSPSNNSIWPQVSFVFIT